MCGRRGGRVDWLLGIQRYGHGFESQSQWVRSAIITEAVFRNFLITPLWFPWGTPVSSNKKKLQRSNSKSVTLCRGRLSAHLLSLHNRANVVGSWSTFTSHRFKYNALIKTLHLFIN